MKNELGVEPSQSPDNSITGLIYKTIYWSHLFWHGSTYNKSAMQSYTDRVFILFDKPICSICCVLSTMFATNKTKTKILVMAYGRPRPISVDLGGSPGT